MFRTMDLYQSIKITDNLTCYQWQGMGNNCNTLVFTNILNGNKPHILIDPGHIDNEFREKCFDHLIKALETDGCNIKEVGMVINTHSHTDHCEANVVMAQNGGVQIAMSKEDDVFRTTDGKKLDAMFGIKTPQFETTTFLKEGDLNLGDGKLELQLMLTPGHSPGSLCFYLPLHKILITGDVVFYGSVGRTDFPGCSTEALGKSIERLSKLDVETLIPGHSTDLGSVIRGKKNVEKNFMAIRMYF